jgi:hypothetical protein
MLKNIAKLLIGVSLIVTSVSCGNKGSSSSEGLSDIPDEIKNEGSLIISEEGMKDFIDNMSSPVEMAALVKSLDVKFSNKYLASTENIEDYVTNNQQAFNLGIYGADLGYLNMYNKTNIVLDYIGAIKTLADGVNVGQFFDFTTLKRLAQNNQNLDSLMYISVHSFNNMDRYLRTNNKSNLSVLIITGVWVEGMYLATQVYNEAPHPELKDRIGEQKIILDKLILFLENFKSDKHFQSLLEDLSVLNDEFKNVKITVEKGESEAVEKDGVLTFIQNDVSIITASDETIQSIINKTEEIRNKLISK